MFNQKISGNHKLRKNICDTIKEWQTKIGYRKECVQLYYKQDTLEQFFEFDASSKAKLEAALELFVQENEEDFGRIQVTGEGDRYCLTIPEQGVEYIHERIAESAFLKDFLAVISKRGKTLQDIEQVFYQYSKRLVREKTKDGHTAFYFAEEGIDDYVYLIDQDEFGLEYHRFTKRDYQKMQESV